MGTERNKTIRGQRIVIDGKRFENCRFENCVIVYRGGAYATPGCEFDDCGIELEDAARRTLELLGELYQKGYAELVELTFDTIRQNLAGRGGATVEATRN